MSGRDPVVVAGAGPTGLMCALALGKQPADQEVLEGRLERVADVQLSFPAILIALLIDGVARAVLPRDAHSDAVLPVLGNDFIAMFKDFAANGPSEDELAVAKKQTATELATSMKEPRWWMTQLAPFCSRGALLTRGSPRSDGLGQSACKKELHSRSAHLRGRITVP